MPKPSIFHERTLALGAILAMSLASPALARSDSTTKVVDCRSGSCLLVSGHRAEATSAVTINGHAVAVEGGRSWRVRVPVATVRHWSAPRARTITVAVAGASEEASLPIGLLGQPDNLAMLFISVK